jgi:hypothetical protein
MAYYGILSEFESNLTIEKVRKKIVPYRVYNSNRSVLLGIWTRRERLNSDKKVNCRIGYLGLD